MATHDEVEAMIGPWIAKAEGDLMSASCIIKLKKNCPTDTVCFHAQQCIEKYIKALLILRGTNFPKTHDIAHLNSSAADKLATKIGRCPARAADGLCNCKPIPWRL